ncbi:MAG: tRNA pseudouridine(38-40) synthase TruA [Tannerella sp.]|nr:tRNA pseudouridine(38-40) synthase TruA [Tannerella sp.]
MSRYFIYLSYNGTRYCGWQIQPNGLSIQQCIEEKLSLLQRQTVNVVGAGRTDAGVHARMMAAHFDSEQPIDDLAGLTAKLNLLLPYDIAIERIIQVKENAHARFDALSRTYQYYVSDRKSAFNHEWVCRMPLQGMDFTQMNRACHILTEYTDFTSFSKLHTDVKTNICLIESAEWQQEGSIWIFTIKADRFLRNMVRAIVGTLFEVGRGKCSLDGFRQIIEARNRCNAGTSVSAKGLALVDITYPEELFDIV